MESASSNWISWTSAVETTLTRCLTGYRERVGVMAIVGEPGIGKSVTARILARGLQDAGHTAGLIAISPSFSAMDLLAMMAGEWRLSPTHALDTRVMLLREMQRRMASESPSKGRVVMILDDCDQLADPDFLGDLRYLRGTGLRGSSPPGTIFCFGRPAFLKTYLPIFPAYRQLDAPVEIPRLPRDEIDRFVAEVCRRSHLRPNAFAPDALNWLAERADGRLGALSFDLDRVVLDDRFVRRDSPIAADELREFFAGVPVFPEP